MIAAMLLILVFFGLTAAFTRGRTQIDYEEDRRKATAVAQARLDRIRRDYHFETLPILDNTDTTIVSDNRTYTVHHVVGRLADPDSLQADTIRITVQWNARVGDHDVVRQHETTTMLGRGMP
ncbi:MAG: hypothetical protein ACE15D_14410 [Candidatus Eisenbacteria bacterium]